MPSQPFYPKESKSYFWLTEASQISHFRAQLRRLKWHYRIRIKSSFYLYLGKRGRAISSYQLRPGEALFFHAVTLTRERYGEVDVALGMDHKSRERWIIVSDQPSSAETFREYSWRFDIEEGFLDDKSNGFHLESSRIRSPQMLSRLCLVLAITTLYLSASGTDVAEYGERRWIDPHWFRGSSYLKIGWRWIRQCLVHGFYLPTDLRLSDTPDPQPAIASRRQAQHRHRAFQFHPPSTDPFSSSNPQSRNAA